MFLFDIKINDRFVNSVKFKELSQGFDTVPELAYDIILEDWLDGKTIQEASNGESALCKTRREGIVIKPMEEQYSPELHGRMLLKQRSPTYLAKEK